MTHVLRSDARPSHAGSARKDAAVGGNCRLVGRSVTAPASPVKREGNFPMNALPPPPPPPLPPPLRWRTLTAQLIPT